MHPFEGRVGALDLDRPRAVIRDGGEVPAGTGGAHVLEQGSCAVRSHDHHPVRHWAPTLAAIDGDDLQYLRVWVSRVRRKLGAEPGQPGRIKTVQGIGYLLDAEPPTPTDRAAEGVGEEEASGLIG